MAVESFIAFAENMVFGDGSLDSVVFASFPADSESCSGGDIIAGRVPVWQKKSNCFSLIYLDFSWQRPQTVEKSYKQLILWRLYAKTISQDVSSSKFSMKNQK